METKTYMYIGVFIGSIAGAGLGSVIDKGNPFGIWGILLSTVGAVVGIWVGYKIGNS